MVETRSLEALTLVLDIELPEPVEEVDWDRGHVEG